MSKYLASLTHGADYLLFRPKPPDKMISRILDYMGDKVGRELAVDVGCGSGQATALLANHFEQVLALDSDETQIDNAIEALKKYKNIKVVVGKSEELPCPDGSVSLVSAVQSAHWFDVPKFFKEVDRVLCRNGVLALSGYRLPKVRSGDGTDLTPAVLELFSGKFGNYISEGSRVAYLDNYRSGHFKSSPISSHPVLREDFETEPKEARLDDLLGYMRTWSTYQNYMKKHGEEAAEIALKEFSNAIQSVDKIFIIFSYFLLLSRKS